MKNRICGVILAGGIGERLWPISRRVFPKYLITVKRHSLLKETYLRIRGVCDEIFVVTTYNQRDLVKGALQGVKFKLIEEPRSKNTLPAVCLAAYNIMEVAKDSIMLVTPADHIVKENKNFEKTLKIALAQAAKTDSLITIGIPPDYPSTSFGYIEVGVKRGGIFPVKRFIEKPAVEDAISFINKGRFFWNSGIFAWKTGVMLKGLNICQPDFSFHFKRRLPVKELYEKLRPLSIDYGIMEKAKNILLVPAQFKWNDMGIWMSLEDIARKDEHGNISLGLSKLIDTKESIIVSNEGLIGAIGVSGVIIVRTKDATLVCNKRYAERVRELVRLIGEDKKLKRFL